MLHHDASETCLYSSWVETCKDAPLMPGRRDSPGVGHKVVNGDVHRFALLDVPQSCDYEVVVKRI